MKIAKIIYAVTFSMIIMTIIAVDVSGLRQELTAYNSVTMKNLSPEARYEIVRKIAQYEKSTGSQEFQRLFTFIKESFWRQWEVPESIRKEHMAIAEKAYLDTRYPDRCPPPKEDEIKPRPDRDLEDWVIIEKPKEEPSKGWYDRLKEKMQSIDWKKVGIGAGVLAGIAAIGTAAYYTGKYQRDDRDMLPAPAGAEGIAPVKKESIGAFELVQPSFELTTDRLKDFANRINDADKIHYIINRKAAYERLDRDISLYLDALKIRKANEFAQYKILSYDNLYEDIDEEYKKNFSGLPITAHNLYSILGIDSHLRASQIVAYIQQHPKEILDRIKLQFPDIDARLAELALRQILYPFGSEIGSEKMKELFDAYLQGKEAIAALQERERNGASPQAREWLENALQQTPKEIHEVGKIREYIHQKIALMKQEILS